MIIPDLIISNECERWINFVRDIDAHMREFLLLSNKFWYNKCCKPRWVMRMRIIVQRAKNARVIVDEKIVGAVDHGLMLLVGLAHDDTVMDVDYCAKKVAQLRIFDDEFGKMNLSVKDVGGGVLSISQFTLYGSTEKGNRPSFIGAARPEIAEPLYLRFNEILQFEHGIQVETGIFGAMMDVDFVNDGPVTLIVESRR